MSLKVNPNQVGLGSLLKEGVKHYQGVDETVLRNIAACKTLMEITASSFGPWGLNKLVINGLDKLFLTNDAGTIMRELEVQHPAARLILLAAQQQDRIMGDGTNLAVLLAGELLSHAEGLIRLGIKPAIIAEGYELAWNQIEILMNQLIVGSAGEAADIRADPGKLRSLLQSVLGAKQSGWQSTLATLVIDALRIAYSSTFTGGSVTTPFNPDNIRCVKLLGGSVPTSMVIPGLVLEREPLGKVRSVPNAKIAIFGCPISISRTETKGTVLFHGAQEMRDFSRGEERILQEQIAAIASAGVSVLVSAESVSELALHFIEAHGMMALRVPSKFDLRRLCRAVGATPLVRLGAPLAEELGWAERVEVREIGGTKCTIFTADSSKGNCGLATIVLRGNTQSGLDDVERAIEDALHTVRLITTPANNNSISNDTLVAGAGACEIELARQLTQFGETTPGVLQYAIKKYAEALEIVPRTLATTAGLDATEAIAKLYWLHSQGATNVGVTPNLVDEEFKMETIKKDDITVWDLLTVKKSAIYVATEAVSTLLRVDQIIESRPAPGPKPRAPGPMDGGDD